MYSLALGHLSRYLSTRGWTVASGLSLSLLLWGASGLVHADTNEKHYRLAVVKMAVVLRRAPQAEAASNKLRNRFAQREEDLAKEQEAVQQAENDYLDNRSVLPSDELVKQESQLRIRQRELTRSREDLREEVRVAKDQALSALQKTVAAAIEAIREQEQIDIVFRESDYIVASQRVDITEQVLAYLRRTFNAQQNKPDAAKPVVPANGGSE